MLITALLAGAAIAGDDTRDAGKNMSQTQQWASEHDRRRAAIVSAREADWRNGPIVYQVIVDRFAPASDLDAKRSLYPPPRRLRKWSEEPKCGQFVPEAGVWSHEIDFWGGDLQSLRGRLDYIHQLGADVLYLNPIHEAYTNHKYDAIDYFAVSPEYGTRDDVKALAADCHQRGMHLILDGVFNHTGRRAPWFTDAMKDPDSPHRGWYYIGDEWKLGYRAWADVENLPELRLENPEVQARIFDDADSVVQGYLREGVDGWRLDVAFDIGPVILRRLTEAAHRAKPDAVVISETWNYPDEWFPAVDGVMNFYLTNVIRHLVNGNISGAQAGLMLDRMVDDSGLDPILKSWIVLDNHDTSRLKTQLPKQWRRHMAQVLQFTLPGSPCVYYGVELGMDGGDDPEQRGPMRWDLVSDDNRELALMRKLITMRRDNRALRVGDFLLLDSQKLLAFMRRTDRVAETTIIIANATDEAISEVVPLREAKFMNWAKLKDEFSAAELSIESGTTQVQIPARTIWVLRPAIPETNEYSAYGRVH